MKGFFVIILLVLFFSCDSDINPTKNEIWGHWYLVDNEAEENSEYFEFIIEDTLTRINKNGLMWYDAEIKVYSEDSIMLRNYLGQYELVNQDSLIIYDKVNKYHFRRVTLENKGVSAKDLEMMRKFKFYAKTTHPEDSSRIEEINNYMWHYFGNMPEKESLDFYEEIEIIPKHKIN